VIASTNVCCDICSHLQTAFCNAYQLSVSYGHGVVGVCESSYQDTSSQVVMAITDQVLVSFWVCVLCST